MNDRVVGMVNETYYGGARGRGRQDQSRDGRNIRLKSYELLTGADGVAGNADTVIWKTGAGASPTSSMLQDDTRTVEVLDDDASWRQRSSATSAVAIGSEGAGGLPDPSTDLAHD